MNRLRTWWWENRTSARAAFVLRGGIMLANGVLSLLWTRLLLRALGTEKYGLYLAFMSFVGLAAAGELGMGGAVSMRTTQFLAAGKLDELRRLHGTARRTFFLVAVVFGLITLGLSPWLPQRLGFVGSAATGSLPLLFAVGAVSVAITVYSSYLGNTTYGAGTVMWPVLPGFLIAQATAAAQVVVAFSDLPLWVLHGAVVGLGLGGLWISWQIYRHSHAVFAERLPYPRGAAPLRDLATTSIWSYFFSLALVVYVSTDRLIINAYFGAGDVTIFQLNAKLCELAASIILAVAGLAMPKLVARLLTASRQGPGEDGRGDMVRVARLQSFLGLGFALGYLWVNDFFVALVFGPGLQPPLALEAAFAVSLVLAANLDTYLQLAGRLSDAGLRFAAGGVLGSAVLNLGLSVWVAAQWRWLPGVAWATCLAQLLLLVALATFVQRRHAPASWASLVTYSLVLPVSSVALGLYLRALLPPAQSWQGMALCGAYLALMLLYSQFAGPTVWELGRELRLSLQRFGLFKAR